MGTDDGDSLHRLQMLIWTVVLGAIFVYSVLQNSPCRSSATRPWH
jgi:hypothetical protein